jgi:heat shock protein HtpX
MNTVKTFVLMMVMSALLLIAGYAIGGPTGIIIALVISLGINFFSYWSSDKLALRMAGAHEVSPEQERELHRIVDEQAEKAGIPKPRVYLIGSDSPNAFATGRSPKHAAIAVTTGIMGLLNREELGAVIAHELAHVGNRDTLIMTMVATIAMAIGMIAMFAQFAMIFGGFGGRDRGEGAGGYGAIAGIVGLLIVAIVLPFISTLVRLAISRAREYQADSTGALTSGNPYALASALEKLEMGTQRRPMKVNEGAAHLYIVNPLRSDGPGHTRNSLNGGGFSRLFSTHPPIRERVRRLKSMRLGW